MSELDVDNESIGSQEPTSSTRRRPLAYGTLVLPEGDELASSSQVIDAIKSSQGRYHILNVEHTDLGDDKIQKVLQELQTPSTQLEQTDQAAEGSRDHAGQHVTHNEWNGFLASLPSMLEISDRPLYYGFRNLELIDNALTSDCMPAICNLLTGNLALHTLDLTANDIDNSNNALISLAEAVGKSALRRLSLSSNPISLASLAAFIDSVPANGTALERLDLSSLSLPVHDDDETTQHQAALAANAIADLITDPQRCRSLVSLTLDGNNFGSRGVRTIASALVGNKICDDEAASGSSSVPLAEVQRDPFFQTVFLAKLRRPNTSLLYLGLSGNVERGWLSMDPNKEIERLVNIKRRYASIPLQDIEAIVSFFHHRTRRQRLQAKETIDNEAPIEVTRHLASLDVTMDEWQADFKEAFEVGSGLNSTNWQIVLLRQLDRNRDDGKECRSAALAVLAAARTLGCRARRQSGSWITEASGSSTASTSAGFPRFLDLPPELRLHILRQLDENASLSARQFNHVISFACEPSTIGYGSDEYSWSRVLDKRVDSVDDEGSSSDATLPARRWSWIECFALRAPPRDWVADLLDSDRSSYGEDYRGVSFLGAPLNAFLESTQTHRAEPK